MWDKATPHEAPPPLSSSLLSVFVDGGSFRFGALPSDFADVPHPTQPKTRVKQKSVIQIPHEKDEDPPDSFVLLAEVVAQLLRLWSWSTSADRSEFQAPTPKTAKRPLPGIDPVSHRYPYCLVWTPIHPITWVCPYVGHVGLCDVDGVVLDFAGKHVGRDAMAFGWPARYCQLSPEEATDWQGEIGRATEQFNRVEYNFLTWNCHSFLAGFLNNIQWPHDQLARTLGCWTVAGVGLRIFLDGRYVGRTRDECSGCGWRQLLTPGAMHQWGGTLGVTIYVLGAGLCGRSWEPAAVWLGALIAFNGFFVTWFGLLAACRLHSQRGDVPEADPEEADADDSDSDDGLCRSGL